MQDEVTTDPVDRAMYIPLDFECPAEVAVEDRAFVGQRVGCRYEGEHLLERRADGLPEGSGAESADRAHPQGSGRIGNNADLGLRYELSVPMHVIAVRFIDEAEAERQFSSREGGAGRQKPAGRFGDPSLELTGARVGDPGIVNDKLLPRDGRST